MDFQKRMAELHKAGAFQQEDKKLDLTWRYRLVNAFQHAFEIYNGLGSIALLHGLDAEKNARLICERINGETK